MRLLIKSIQFHFLSYWSTPLNFWSGVIGMLVNNILTLLGVWAMLFAGKSQLDSSRDLFLITNFVMMTAWGLVHIFLGGVRSLDQQIQRGSLDLILTTPRSLFLMSAITASSLPAWADLILGIFGLFALSLNYGGFFLFHSFYMIILATLALFSLFILIGALTFWMNRTESLIDVLVNIILVFNTYPIFQNNFENKLFIFVIPILLAGVIPAQLIIAPSIKIFLLEFCGSFLLYFFCTSVFKLGLKKYQSSSLFTGIRS